MPCVLRLSRSRRHRLQHWLLREWTIDFFRFYLGVDVTAIQLDSPRNCLLLDRMASKAFTGHYWTLRPTEVSAADITSRAGPNTNS